MYVYIVPGLKFQRLACVGSNNGFKSKRIFALLVILVGATAAADVTIEQRNGSHRCNFVLF
jgi:hypothetical protein